MPQENLNITIQGSKIIISSEELPSEIVTGFNKTISLPYANIMILRNANFNVRKARDMGDMNRLKLSYKTKYESTEALQEALDIDLADKNSTVLILALEYANKDKAKDILNELVKIYNFDASNDKNIESEKTRNFIDERIDIIATELGDIENDKERYKRQNNIVDLPTEGRINLEVINQAKGRQLDVETQLEVNGILLSYLRNQSNSQVLPLNIGLNNDAAAKGIDSYNQLVLERNKLLESGTVNNPIIKDIDKQIAEVKGAITQSLLKNRDNLVLVRNQYAKQLNESDSRISKIPSQEKQFRIIERHQQVKENLYLMLLQKREEAAITLAMTADKARVVDYAYVDKKPVSPKKMLIFLGAFILGIAIPVAYIYLKELFNNKITTKSDIERLSAVPIMVEIPRNIGKQEIIESRDVSPMAEAFRILMTNLRFTLGSNGKVIFVTSSVKGEGKTFISMNLALTYASVNKKVLIIGADVRNPQLQRYVPGSKSQIGLSEYLSGYENDLDRLVSPSPFSPYCDIIFSGSIPPNPVELLSNGRMDELMAHFKGKYDYIILDTAPTMLVTDSNVLAHHADVTLYVTRSEVTLKGFIGYANSAVANRKLHNVNFILNDVHKSNFSYGNKYGYGYHAEEQGFFARIKERLFG